MFASPSACHSASGCQISSKLNHPRHSYDVIYISKMVAVSHIELSQGYCRPLTKCKWSPRSVLKFRLDRIYSFGDIAISVLWCSGLKLPIQVVVSAGHAQNEGLVYFQGWNWLYIWICMDLPIHHPVYKSIAGRLMGVYWRRPHVKERFEPKFCPVENRPKIAYLAKIGSKCKNLFPGAPKGNPCAKRRLLTYRSSKSVQRPEL